MANMEYKSKTRLLISQGCLFTMFKLKMFKESTDSFLLIYLLVTHIFFLGSDDT
jgi:hypothetical protein